MEEQRKETKDDLLDNCISDFEKKLILQCREDGMTDEEIAKWLKEI